MRVVRFGFAFTVGVLSVALDFGQTVFDQTNKNKKTKGKKKEEKRREEMSDKSEVCYSSPSVKTTPNTQRFVFFLIFFSLFFFLFFSGNERLGIR